MGVVLGIMRILCIPFKFYCLANSQPPSLSRNKDMEISCESADRKATSIPKHLVPCPFLRRGYCLKGGKCDFSHNINVQQPFQFPQQRTLPLNFPQPLMNYPIYHPFLNFPYPQPLMDIPTRPFRC